MLNRDEARNGEAILTYQGKALLSRFNPSREAERFVAARHPPGSVPKTVLIVGDILGYLARASRRLFPKARLVGLELSSELDNPAELYDALFRADEGPPGDYLSAELDDQASKELLILQWEPSLRLYPGRGALFMQAIRRRLLIAGGNLTTLRGFGRRWVRNSLINYLFQNDFVGALYSGRGAHLIASGPSLEHSRNLLKQSGGMKVALASSLAFLREYKLEPDLIIQTDPGIYALHHLRLAREAQVPVAMPFSALPLAEAAPGTPLLIIDQQEPLEKELIRLLGLAEAGLPALPSAGTVAASALFLMQSLKAEPILLSGLDLCYDDIRTHSAPHSFDQVFSGESSRLRPLYSLRFRYSRETAAVPGQSRALKTYADWFRGLMIQDTGTVYRLYPSAVDLPFPTLSRAEYQGLQPFDSGIACTALSVPSRAERQAALIEVLTKLTRNRLNEKLLPLARELGEKLDFPWHSAEERRTSIEALIGWVSSLGAE